MSEKLQGRDAASSAVAVRADVFKNVSSAVFLGRPLYMWAVWFSFFSAGFLYSQFTSRMPALSEHASLGMSDLGLMLMFFAMGSVTGLLSAGFIMLRFSAANVLRAALCGVCAGLLLLTFVTGLWQLRAAFAVWGFAFALLDVCMNTQAMYLESHTGGRCMATSHANYSFGCVFGSLVSALFAFCGAGIVVNYTVTAGAVLLLFMLCLRRHLLPDPERAARAETQNDGDGRGALALLRSLPLFVMLCGLVSILAYSAEGSVAEWGSLVMFESKGAAEALAATAYGVLALSMGVTRLFVDSLRGRVDDGFLIAGGAVIASCMLFTVIVTESPYVCLAAYALMGVGIAPVCPIAFSRAGTHGGVSPKTASTVIAVVGYTGFLAVPPALGYVGERFGMDRAL